MKYFYTYILCNKPYGTLYTGSTDNLGKRIEQHRRKIFNGFTEKYDVTRLAWYEVHETRDAAFSRERQIKKWKRHWKIDLIDAFNPDWDDFFETENLG